MARTTAEAVKDLLIEGGDYPPADQTQPPLTGRIASANVIVTRVATCATAKGLTLNATELELVERWLAAHFYCVSDRTYAEKNTGKAGAVFDGRTGMSLDATLYGQTAQTVDYSGCLSAIGKRRRASIAWLGLPPSEQTDYDDRD